jgi:hypothetical protein
MNLLQLLDEQAHDIVDEANSVIVRSRLPHYEEVGAAESERRLQALYDLTRQSIRERNLVPMIDYMQGTARERYQTGFELREVQIAVNVLEETIWKRVAEHLPPDQLAEALGLVSTVLGAAKDALARSYVSLAGQSKAPSLNLSAIFKGAGG